MSLYFLTASLWHYYAISLFMAVVGSGSHTPVPYSKVISRWFDQKRGLALGLVMVGPALGGFILPPLAQALITGVGWRQAYVFLGLLVIGITMPVVGLFLKETPQRMGLLPDGETVIHTGTAKPSGQEPGLSCHEAWHTGVFWLMVGAFFLQSVGFHGYLIHLVPLLTDRGVSAQSAALVMSIGAVGGNLGRVGGGYLLDRCFAPYVAACFFCGSALGLFLLWNGAAGGLAFVAAFLGSLGVGAEFDIIAYMVSRYFGLRAFGEIYGYVFAAFTLGGVIGPPLMGIGFDSTGSYSPVLGGFVVTTLMAVGLMTQLGPYRVWEVDVEPVVAAGVSGS
jgi:MFS family permease